jgi:hypothetical protein
MLPIPLQGGGLVNSFARQMSQKRHAHVAFHAERSMGQVELQKGGQTWLHDRLNLPSTSDLISRNKIVLP